MKIGCCGTAENYGQISKSGYDYIEMSGRLLMSLSEYQREDFLKFYKNNGFPCIAINDYCGADVAIVGPNFSTSAIRTYAKKLMEYASKLGVKNVGIGSPAARKLPEGYSEKSAMFEMFEFLYITCEEAAKYDINVLLEAVHSGLTDYLNYTKDAVTIVKAMKGIDTENIDPEVLKLCSSAICGRKRPETLWIVYDYYNSMAMKESLDELVYAMPLVKHLHYSTDLGDNDRGYPDAGQLEEITKFLQLAKDHGYEGNISVEANYTKYLNYGAALSAKIMRMALPR